MDLPRLIRVAFRYATLSPPLTKLYDWVYHRFGSPIGIGKRGELAAERFLLRQGWIIVERGFESRGGEIDLIAVDGRTVVFVEVKTRASAAKGHPTEAVDFEKQRHLTNTAFTYLKKKQLTECATRFDVIAIIWPNQPEPKSIEHFKNAFEPAGKFQLV